MKKRTLIKSALSGLGLLAVATPLVVGNINNVSNYIQTSITNQSDSKLSNNTILSDDIQAVNQSTQTGFIGKTDSTVFSSNFYGENLWTYDLTTSKFLLNDDGSYKKVTNFLIKYDETSNVVAVVGSYTSKTGSTESFYFQLKADSGEPYFSNEDPSLTDEQKHLESVITSEKDSKLTKNPSSILFNQGYANIFNENTLKSPANNKPTQISVTTLNTTQLSFDETFLNNITSDGITTDVFLGVSVLPNGYLLASTGNVNASGTLDFIRMFLLDSTLKTVNYSSGGASRITILDKNKPGISVPDGVYKPEQYIRELIVCKESTNTYNIVVPFVGSGSVPSRIVNITYTLSTNVMAQNPNANNWITSLDVNTYGQISHITKDETNKKLYFTTTKTTDNTLVEYDIATRTFKKLSDDPKYSNARISSFLTSTNTSQVVLNKTENGQQLLYGYQMAIGGNTQGEVAINIPEIKDFNQVAKEKNLVNKMPGDIDPTEAESLLEISNYNTSDYSAKLKGSLVPSNENGTLSYSLDVSIKQWWDKAHPSDFTSTRGVNLTGFISNETQKFQLVTNSTINAEKYKKVAELQNSIFLSDIKKSDILNYFIDYGSGLSFTENDISLNGDNANAQIKAVANNQTGELTISYEITENKDKTSLLNGYKTGTQTFEFTKNLNNYKQLQLNRNVFSGFFYNKYAADIVVDDLISSMDWTASGNGYDTDVSKWKWTYDSEVNSLAWVEDQLSGRLAGTLTYLPSSNEPTTVPGNYQLKVEETGFKSLSDYINGSMNSNGKYNDAIIFNEALANSLTLVSSKQDILDDIDNIVKQTMSTNNNWVSSDQLQYSVNLGASADNTVVVDVSIPKNAKTNIEFTNVSGGAITLNNNWVTGLSKINSDLFNTYSFTFSASETTYSWNVDKANTESSITVADVNSASLSKYGRKLPSTLVDDLSNNPMYFQEMTNLLNETNAISLDSNTSTLQSTTSSTNQNRESKKFIIQDIQLTPNDEVGTLTANYTLVYPEAGNVTKTASVTIAGFLSIWDIILFWIGIIIIIALICIAIWAAIHYIKKNDKKKRIWSTHNYVKNFKKTKNIK